VTLDIDKGELQICERKTKRVRTSLQVTPGSDIQFAYRWEGHQYLIAGQHIVDVTAEKIVAQDRRLNVAGARIQSADGRYLYYRIGRGERSLNLTRIICLDLKLRKIVAERDLQDPGEDWNASRGYVETRQLLLLPDGRLIALAGDGADYPVPE
jgi:hypothetical protein